MALSVDGLGDFASAAWGSGDETGSRSTGGSFSLTRSASSTRPSPNSWASPWGDEYKVMGLAPYGEPRYVDQLREAGPAPAGRHLPPEPRLLSPPPRGAWLPVAQHRARGWSPCTRRGCRICSASPGTPGGEITDRDRDMARSPRSCSRPRCSTSSRRSMSATTSIRLALAGGCAINSVGNGKIYERSPFQQVYVPPGGRRRGWSDGGRGHGLVPARRRPPLRAHGSRGDGGPPLSSPSWRAGPGTLGRAG